MSFYTSLSGLRAAQTELATVSNNLANVTSTGFKKSRAQFGDLFSSSPTQTTKMIAGQGARLNAVNQQFTQGTLEATDRTLDMAIAGEGFFVVRGDTATGGVTYSRNGAFQVDVDHNVVDSLGSIMQLLPVDANGVATSSSLADSFDFVVPTAATGNPNALLSNITVGIDGLVVATFGDGSEELVGTLALASFTAPEGLRPIGDAHWQSTDDSGVARVGTGNNGSLGAIRSGTLERANVDVTEELVALIAAQRNFQANSKAIETASNMTQAIINLN